MAEGLFGIFRVFLVRDSSGFFYFIICAFIMGYMTRFFYKAKNYFYNFSFPEADVTPVDLVDRWWIGFILSLILLSQIVTLLFFFLPLLFGLTSLLMAKFFFPESGSLSFPYSTSVGNWPGRISYLGLMYVFVGILYWRKIMSDVPKTSWLDPVIMNIDKAAIITLSAASFIMTILSFTNGYRFTGQSLTISLFIAILSAAAYRLEEYFDPTPRAIYLYTQTEFRRKLNMMTHEIIPPEGDCGFQN